MRVMAAAAMLATTIGTPVAAQQRGDVIVTAPRQSSREQVERVVRRLSATVEGQLARWGDAVCAGSIGLPPDLNRAVAARITADARAAAIPVAGAGCRPNVTAVFVEDGRALLAELDRTGSPLLAGVGRADRRRLLAEPGPVRVVSQTDIRSRDGDRLREMGPGGMRSPNGAPFLNVRTASYINPTTRRDIVGVLVVVDLPATLGKTVRQLGDYAAMRGLARTRDNRVATGSDTILTLFAPDAVPPRALTSFDLAYLKGLYAGGNDRTARVKTAQIAQGMVEGD